MDEVKVSLIKKHYVEGLGWRGIYLVEGLRVTIFSDKEEELEEQAKQQAPFVNAIAERITSEEHQQRLLQNLVWMYGEDSEEVAAYKKKHGLS